MEPRKLMRNNRSYRLINYKRGVLFSICLMLILAACGQSVQTSQQPTATQGKPLTRAEKLKLTMAAGLDPMLTVTSALNPDVTLNAGASASEYADTPDFFLTTFEGENFRLSEQRGKVVVVNFWASWCGPCRREMPDFMNVWEQYKDRGVVFVGVDTQDSPESGYIFASRLGIKYPLGYDRDDAIARAYYIRAFPTTILITPQGKTKIRIPGEMSAKELIAYLDAMLPKLREHF
jgi:peroxiredoxin